VILSCRRALDAKLLLAVPVGDKGRTMHVRLQINGSWKMKMIKLDIRTL
jgi:hypothetical protein